MCVRCNISVVTSVLGWPRLSFSVLRMVASPAPVTTGDGRCIECVLWGCWQAASSLMLPGDGVCDAEPGPAYAGKERFSA